MGTNSQFLQRANALHETSITLDLSLFPCSNAGVSRSSSIALSYVMHREGTPLDEALERLRVTRPAVRPNDGFMKQLRETEKKLGISNNS